METALVDIKKTTVSDPENKAILNQPALFVNKLYLTKVPSGAKVTFAEINSSAPGEVSTRASVFLQHADLFALHDLIGSVLKDIKLPETPKKD